MGEVGICFALGIAFVFGLVQSIFSLNNYMDKSLQLSWHHFCKWFTIFLRMGAFVCTHLKMQWISVAFMQSCPWEEAGLSNILENWE